MSGGKFKSVVPRTTATKATCHLRSPSKATIPSWKASSPSATPPPQGLCLPEAAVDAAQSGETVNADCRGFDCQGRRLVLGAGDKNVTIDLNGSTTTSTARRRIDRHREPGPAPRKGQRGRHQNGASLPHGPREDARPELILRPDARRRGYIARKRSTACTTCQTTRRITIKSSTIKAPRRRGLRRVQLRKLHGRERHRHRVPRSTARSKSARPRAAERATWPYLGKDTVLNGAIVLEDNANIERVTARRRSHRPDEYKWVEQANGHVQLAPRPMLRRSSEGKSYETLQDAVDAAESGQNSRPAG